MDKSFQGSPLGHSATFFSATSRTPKRPVGPSPFRKSSRWSVSAKSTQSVQVILKTQQNSIERFGQPPPVLITEALTFADRNTEVSARISDCGYAWVVCGRRLLIWQYRQSVHFSSGTPQKKVAVANICYELQLPQSDLSHRAELVNVFFGNGSHTPSCIAVSPEGVIRYWPAVSHEDVLYEQTVDLQGQECDSLTDIQGFGCILATTTCSIILVQPQFSSGRHILTYHPLKVPTGWLGGISKRVSSLIFGPISSEQSAETRLVRVHNVQSNKDSCIVFILAGHSLQKWNMTKNQQEQLIYTTDLNRTIRDHFHTTFWENCVGESDIDLWMLDVQHDKETLVLLTAAVNSTVSPQIHYALFSVPIESNQLPLTNSEFKILKVSGLYREDNPAETLSYRLLCCNNSSYMFNKKTITVIKTQDEPDVIEFNTPQDIILGGSICVNTPIFFTKNNGLLAVVNNDLNTTSDLNMSMGNLNVSMDQTIAENNLSLYHLDAKDIYNAYKDINGQLRSSFIFHVKKQMGACMEIINELFGAESGVPGVDAVLDKHIISMGKELIDDIPACDPRWSNSVNNGLGSSYSMQIANQLEDKLKALNLFYQFLRETGLWNRLSGYTIRDTPTATVYVLGELLEKVTAAIYLNSLQKDDLLHNAIARAVKDVDIERKFGLKEEDIFYCIVSNIHKGAQELVNGCGQIVNSDLNPTEIANIIIKSNEILIGVLLEVLHCRKCRMDNFRPSETALTLAPDYLPWTAANGSEGLMDSLWEQHGYICYYGLKYVGNKQIKEVLIKQLVSLIDIILDGRKCHIESIKGNNRGDLQYRQYCIDRQKLIKPLIQEKEWEGAAQLAEKFLDFESLILICEATDNQARLDEYITRFNKEGFAEYVYNWYLRENKQGKLLERCRKFNNENVQKLTGFLGQHPSLLWIQQVFDKNFNQAATTLSALSKAEQESVTKQKTFYSLAKLSKLAAQPSRDTEHFVQTINAKLNLISYQEEIPDYVLQQFGYDTVNPAVISAKELINLYVCNEFTDATEYEFKKALDLLKFVEDEDTREDLWLTIWRQALLRDDWNFEKIMDSMDVLQSTMFFRLANVAIVLGFDSDQLLPPIDILLEDPKFEEMKNNKTFIYLLKTGYEYIENINSAES